MSITKNKWHDEFCDSFPEATKFHTILRNRCLEVDSENLSSWVHFNCCPSKKCLYIVGYSIAEIFIATLYDYIFSRVMGLMKPRTSFQIIEKDHGAYISSSNSIIHSLEFKIPKFGVECIEAIKSATGEGYEYYLQGNIMKYLWRYRYKNGVQDLEKAQWYLNKLIEVKKGSKDSTDVFTSFGIELDNGC